jgi:putative ABC transport system permease protein
VDITIAEPNYFELIGQQLIAGDLFTERDTDRTPAVAVINQTMARHRWPGENPIGQKISINMFGSWMTIVGIVSDTREYGLPLPTRDEVYLPTAQQGGFSSNLIVRTAFDPAMATPFVRAALHEVDPLIGLDQIGTLEHFQYESMAAPRVTTALMAIFAGLALLISTGGIAAVMTLAVTQRTRELGIRMALGADRGGLIGMVVRQGLGLAILGVVVGAAGALALTRLLSTLLYATSPADVLTFIGVSVLFLMVGAAACFMPARQVTAIDPLSALREENRTLRTRELASDNGH